MCCLLRMNIAALILTLIAAVVIPATLPSIVVVTQDESVDSRRVALCVGDVSHPMELFSNCALNDNILLVLVILFVGFEVQLVVIGVRDHNLCSLHVHRNGQDSVE